jgi:hypothetical protein
MAPNLARPLPTGTVAIEGIVAQVLSDQRLYNRNTA